MAGTKQMHQSLKWASRTQFLTHTTVSWRYTEKRTNNNMQDITRAEHSETVYKQEK